MSQDAGFFAKLVILGGSAVAMIGRCATTAGDDIIRIGARSFDDVAMVSDDIVRYGDDVFVYKDGLLKNRDNVLLGTSKSSIDETITYFDDIFSDIAMEGADWILDEDEEEFEVPEENLLSDFQLDSVKTIRLGLSKNKHIFNDETKANFLKILSYSTPIENPKEPLGKLVLLQGSQTYSMNLGKDWVAIKNIKQKNYKYYSLKVDFTKGF